MAHGFSPGYEVRERVAVSAWTSGSGTDREFGAVQRFRLQCEVLLPCWRALVHA
jgi:hypothetical protein